MGIFSDRCKNEDCRARVKKGAHFCSVCGYAGPNSLTVCPDCHKKVGRTSRFCWNCGADASEVKVPRIVGDRWVRQEEEIAVRVDPDDLKGFLSRKVTVEPGTVGLIERNGRLVKETEWGAHSLDGLLKLRSPNSILLIRAADLVLRPTFDSLRDKNGADLDVTVQAVLRIKDYDAFVRQFFAGHKRRVTYTTLEQSIGHELHDVLRGLVSAHALDEMYGNLGWRDEFESKIRDAMTVTLDRHGLELLQVNFVEFGGGTFEALQQDRGETFMGSHAADHLAEKVGIQRRTAELEAQGKLDEFKTDKDLAEKIEELNSQHHVRSALRAGEREEAVAQARQELKLKNQLREYELEDLTGERAKQKQDEQLAREQMLEKITVGHQNEVAVSLLIARQKRDASQAEFEREQARLADEAELAAAWARSEQERRNQREEAVMRYEAIVKEAEAETKAALERMKAAEAEQSLKHRGQDKELERLHAMQRMEMEMLTSVKKLEMENKKIELDYKRFEKEKETEVQLASIEGNVRIAESTATTDAAVARAERNQMEARLADAQGEKHALREDGQRQADNMNRLAETIGKAHQNQPNVVVAGGAQVAGSAGGAANTSPCPNCGRPVDINDSFCRKCGHSMQERRV